MSDQVTLARREVWFDVASLDAALLGLRTADDVFVEVGRAARASAQDAVDAVLGFDWPASVAAVAGIRAVAPSPDLDVVASVEGHNTLNRFAVEHAVGPQLAAALGGRYLRRTAAGRDPGSPSITARIFVRGGDVVATLRLGAAPLHRRAYKQDTGPGTLHPPVAAALARLAAPQPGEQVLDPFCGDGTIAIEAALAFPAAHLAGSDIDQTRLANAERNAARAGAHVSWRRQDATRLAGGADVVVTNPPWDISVRTTGRLDAFWQRLPQLLGPSGRLAAITDADLDVPSTLTKRGVELTLATRIRLAGRVSHLMLTGPLPDAPATWRQRALAAEVVTPAGF